MLIIKLQHSFKIKSMDFKKNKNEEGRSHLTLLDSQCCSAFKTLVVLNLILDRLRNHKLNIFPVIYLQNFDFLPLKQITSAVFGKNLSECLALSTSYFIFPILLFLIRASLSVFFLRNAHLPYKICNSGIYETFIRNTTVLKIHFNRSTNNQLE